MTLGCGETQIDSIPALAKVTCLVFGGIVLGNETSEGIDLALARKETTDTVEADDTV